MALGPLDFVYMPSRDVAGELERLSAGLGAEVVFAIEAFGARVAMLQPGEGAPALLLADHVAGERAIFVYRVPDLADAMGELRDRGVEPGESFGIPHGSCCSFELKGGHRFALYELTRPAASDRFAGRRDF